MNKKVLREVSRISNMLGATGTLELFEAAAAYVTGKGCAADYKLSGEIEVLAKALPSNAVIFDVGANNGEWALSLARHLKNPKFYLFECAPICIAEISKRLPRIPHGELFTYAVSDDDGVTQFFTPIRGSGLSSVHERHDVGINKETYEKIQVPRKRIDTVVAELGISHIDLLKMDIEGHELSALRGAANSIRNGSVSNIMFEFGSANVNSRTYFVDFWNTLKDHYKLFRILPSGSVYYIESYSERLEYFRGSTNYLAILK